MALRYINGHGPRKLDVLAAAHPRCSSRKASARRPPLWSEHGSQSQTGWPFINGVTLSM